MKTYKFKAILIENDERTGYKKGKTIYPKGFYYQKKQIILVGDVITGGTTRLALPKNIVNVEITEE